MTKKDEQNNTNKSRQRNPGGPEPLSGSHKVKNRQHTHQKKHSHHDM